MSTILDDIVEKRRRSVARFKDELPLDSFRDQLTKSDRDFAGALRSHSTSFILECKRASPSRGLIRSDFDLPEIARVYGQFASAISVLTETEHFQGSFEDLTTIRKSVEQPVLCKDFIQEPYQVFLARHHGADAILLILATLDDERFTELLHSAQQLGMDAITEVSNEAEQKRAIKLGAPIVGINNRNLRDLSIDWNTTRQLSGGLRERATVISESGYRDHEQVRNMSQYADGFLVGSSLMAQSDLSSAVRKLIFGENKVCGLTRLADAEAAAEAGAVYGGLIFADESPRRVAPEIADQIAQLEDLKFVGVFQDQSVDYVAATSRRLSLAAVQLHGNESEEFVDQLRQAMHTDCKIWKAVSVDEIGRWQSPKIDRLVVDNKTIDAAGGTGAPFDWSKLPTDGRQSVILAGGLSPENVEQACQLGCAGLDFNSGVEVQPGIKDPEKIQDVFRQIRAY